MSNNLYDWSLILFSFVSNLFECFGEKLPPMAQFSYNNSVTSPTGITPFYANFGFHPTTMNPPAANIFNPASKVYAHWMKTVHEATKIRLGETQERMRRYADLKRQDTPVYKVGDCEPGIFLTIGGVVGLDE